MTNTQRHAVLDMCKRLLDTVHAATFEFCLTTEESVTEAQLTEISVVALRTTADALEKSDRMHDTEATVRVLREAFDFHQADVDVEGVKRG